MRTHKGFSHVIFDLDGTLLDTLEDIADSCNWMCEQHGWPTHTLQEFCYIVGNGAAKIVERAVPEHARTPEQLEQLLKEYNDYYGIHKSDKTHPYDGLPQLLERLKQEGVCVAVLTNKPDSSAKGVMEQYYPGVFSLVQGGLPDVPLKPDPAAVHMLMERMGAEKENTLFVGDSNVDIQTAKNSGIASCGVLWGFRTRKELEEEGADYIAPTFATLLNIILGQE